MKGATQSGANVKIGNRTVAEDIYLNVNARPAESEAHTKQAHTNKEGRQGRRGHARNTNFSKALQV